MSQPTREMKRLGVDKKSLTYANGMNISSAKKVSEFYFGEFFSGIKKNYKERTFVIQLAKETSIDGKLKEIKKHFTKEYIENFKNYWGGTNGFELQIVEEKNLSEYDEMFE